METNEKYYVFIYAKDKKIKVLNFYESKILHAYLIKEGWKHTQTLDACLFLEYIHNDGKNIEKEIKSLSK